MIEYASNNNPKVEAGIRRAGRILLWLIFVPLGWWRSVRHGRKDTEQRILTEIRLSEARIMAEIRKHDQTVRAA